MTFGYCPKLTDKQPRRHGAVTRRATKPRAKPLMAP
jgi:hypothetical protein